MHLPSVERFRLESDGGGVAALDAVDGDFASQLHPGHSEDGASVGTRQREDVLLIVLQEAQHPCKGNLFQMHRNVQKHFLREANNSKDVL